MKSWKEENLTNFKERSSSRDNIYLVSFMGNGNTFLKAFTSVADIREAFENFNNSRYYRGSEEHFNNNNYYKGRDINLTNREIYRDVFKIAKVDEDHNVGKFWKAMFDNEGNIVKIGKQYWVDEGDKNYSPRAASWFPHDRQWMATPGKFLFGKDE